MENDATVKTDGRPETIQFFFRKHWTRFFRVVLSAFFLGLLVLLVLVVLYLIVVAMRFTFFERAYVFLAVFSTFLYFNLFFLEVFRFYFDLVIVTENAIILSNKSVYMRDESITIDLTKIQDISVESRGLLHNYLRYGRLYFLLSASVPPIVVDCVPYPHYYLEQINRVKREHIVKRQERKSGTLRDTRSPSNPAEPLDHPPG